MRVREEGAARGREEGEKSEIELKRRANFFSPFFPTLDLDLDLFFFFLFFCPLVFGLWSAPPPDEQQRVAKMAN